MITAFVVAALMAQSPEYEAEPATEARLNVLALEVSGLGGLLAGSGALSFERVVAPHSSVVMALAVPLLPYGGGIYWPYLTQQTDSAVAGGLLLGVRWYPGARAPSGFFFGPEALVGGSLSNFRSTYLPPYSPELQTQEGRTTGLELEGGLLVGYSAVLEVGLVVQFAGGLAATYRTSWSTIVGASPQTQTSSLRSFRVAPMGSLSLGWNF